MTGHERAVPVLLVGGGVSGLTASILLADLGIESLLIERHPGTARVPKAHIIHTRTMEIFRGCGLEAEVRARGCPTRNFTHTSWYTSLGGGEPWDRRLITSIPSWSHGSEEARYARYTPTLMSNVPQHLLEPILRSRAEELNGRQRVLFGHELTGLEQDGEGVTVTILDRESGTSRNVRARFVVAADGGKTVSTMLGIPTDGPDPFVDVVSVTFDADLSPYLHEDHSLIRLFLQPQLDGTVRRFSIVASGPEPWGRHCRHWRTGIILPPGGADGANYTATDATHDLRQLFKLPDLDLTVTSMARWLVESTIARRFRENRVFLVGDAAHRHSPMGGLGMNTGVQDVHNLAWKLAATLQGQAGPALLDTYDDERRPVARRRVEFATFAFFNHLGVSGGFGMLPGAAAEHNRAVLEALFSDTADGAMRRAQLTESIRSLRREFQHADIDLGYEYANSRVVTPDGSAAPPRDPVGAQYLPVARPGHRMPHAWLERAGVPTSTHDLLETGSFLLLAGPHGAAWDDAARAVRASDGFPLTAHVVGDPDNLRDPNGDWAHLCGHVPDGAVLIRPDGHVAFRAPTRADDPAGVLRTAMLCALGHTLDTADTTRPRTGSAEALNRAIDWQRRLMAANAAAGAIEDIRRVNYSFMAERAGPLPADLIVEKVDTGAVPGEWVHRGDDSGVVLLFLHSGGCVLGSGAENREMLGRMTAAIGARALAIDFRLAPEHPWPAQCDDTVTAYQWLLDQNIVSSRIVVVGESGGGGVALAAAQALRDSDLPPPAAVVLLSPLVDLALTAPSLDDPSTSDAFVSRAGLETMMHALLAGQDPRAASPLNADLTGLPPFLIQVGAADAIRDDGRRLAALLGAVGGHAELELWPSMIHLWHGFPDLPDAARAITRIAEFVHQHIPIGV